MQDERLLRHAIREILSAPMTGMVHSVMPDAVQWNGFALGPSAGQQVREMESSTKRAACVLIRHGGRVLAVSRKDDHTAMGLPGGKVDPEDGPPDTIMACAGGAARELREETGLSVDPKSLKFVFERGDDDGYTTTTFEAEWRDVCGPIRTSESGRVRWVTWDELLAGPFGGYNRELMAVAGQ